MGKLESEARIERRKGYIRQALLASVAIPGILLVAAAVPNVIQLIEKFAPNKYKLKYRLKSTASRLVALGQIRFVERDGKKHMEITEKGRHAFELEKQKALLRGRQKRRWDKRWRMIIFDIPERYRGTRDKLRILLRSLGFVRLQASVWVFPYDCEEVVTLLKAELGVGYSTLYTIVEKIEDDKKLKEHFNLG